MLIDDLAYELAVNESEILRFLSVRGVMLDNVQTLDKNLVEVLESGPVKVEEMAKRKEFLDEEDLDKWEVRPPIVTMMGHVDHGKTTLLDLYTQEQGSGIRGWWDNTRNWSISGSCARRWKPSSLYFSGYSRP